VPFTLREDLAYLLPVMDGPPTHLCISKSGDNAGALCPSIQRLVGRVSFCHYWQRYVRHAIVRLV
jgi:hypothetical protein